MSTVEQAVTFLGVDVIQSLALSEHVFSKCPAHVLEAFPINRLWQAGAGTGFLAREIAKTEQRSAVEIEQAFIAGLLHDTGILMFAINCTERYHAVLERARVHQLRIAQVEYNELQATHSEI